MTPLMIAYLATYGINAVVSIIDAWKAAGSPTEDEIRAAFITMRPEDYFTQPATKEAG